MKDRNKMIHALEVIHDSGLVITVVLFGLAAACLCPGIDAAAGYWLLGTSILTALIAGVAKMYAAVLTSDQVYIDHGMTPPRLRK